MIYKIAIKNSVYKFLSKINKIDKNRIIKKIEDLAQKPRGTDTKKLSPKSLEKYRVRVGDYRIVYQIIDDLLVVQVIDINFRKDIYK